MQTEQINKPQINKMTKMREPWIDIAKGILITFVALVHVPWATSSLCGNPIPHIEVMNFWGFHLIVPFYMCCFFVITGYCSNFNKSLKDMITRDSVQLFWPTLFLTSFEQYFAWFVAALFVAKIIYWLILRYVKNEGLIWGILFLLSLFAILGQPIIKKHWYLCHAMDLCLYLHLGVWLKKNINNHWLHVASAIIYISIVATYAVFDTQCPAIYGNIDVQLSNLPIHWLSAISGCTFFLMSVRYIQSCKPFEYLGKYSLVVYLVHVGFICKVCKLTYPFVQQDMLLIESLIYYILLAASGLVGSAIVARVLDTKYLKWTLGKF